MGQARVFDPDRMAAVVSEGLKNFNEERADEERAYAATFSYEKHMQQYIDLFLS